MIFYDFLLCLAALHYTPCVVRITCLYLIFTLAVNRIFPLAVLLPAKVQIDESALRIELPFLLKKSGFL